MHHASGLESVTCNCINDALRGVVLTRLFFCIRLTLRHCLLLEPQHDFPQIDEGSCHDHLRNYCDVRSRGKITIQATIFY